MNTLLIVLAAVCLVVGIVAVFTPVPPAVPVAWAGLLLARLAGLEVSTQWLIWAAVVGAILMVADYVFPLVATKRYGGSKWGVWGCTIGLLVAVIGVPFGPAGLLGVFFWPFVGALVGEWMKQKDGHRALRAAWGSFVGMMTGTVLKVVYGIVLLIKVVVEVVHFL